MALGVKSLVEIEIADTDVGPSLVRIQLSHHTIALLAQDDTIESRVEDVEDSFNCECVTFILIFRVALSKMLWYNAG